MRSKRMWYILFALRWAVGIMLLLGFLRFAEGMALPLWAKWVGEVVFAAVILLVVVPWDPSYQHYIDLAARATKLAASGSRPANHKNR